MSTSTISSQAPAVDADAGASGVAGAALPGQWHAVGAVALFPADAGIAVRVGSRQIAVYRSAATDEWFASDNHCPHAGYAVLARGLIGDSGGEPKVACPMHKRSFSLRTGHCFGDAALSVRIYQVRVAAGQVEVLVPVPV